MGGWIFSGWNPVEKLSTKSPIRAPDRLLLESKQIISKMKQDLYDYSLTSDEDCVLLDMITFFNDCGLPPQIEPKAFESLCNKFYGGVPRKS